MNVVTPRETSASFIRELGAFEQLFLAMDRHRPLFAVMAFEVSGAIEPAAWRRGLRALQGRHPVLSSFVGLSERGVPAFYRVEDAPIPMRIVAGRTGADWRAEAEHELSRAFDASRAPLMRTVLIPEHGKSTCLIALHHAAGDGRAMRFLIRDLLTAMSGTPLRPAAEQPSREVLIERVLGSGPRVESASESHPSPRPNTYSREGAKPRVLGRRLGADLTSRILQRARVENTTVHGALCAAVALAGHRRSAIWPPTVHVNSPIDISALLGVNDECTLMLTPGKATCAIQASTRFWDIARSMREQTAEGATAGRILGRATELQAFLASRPDPDAIAAAAAAGFASEAILTNLGTIPFERRFGPLTLEIIYAPALTMGFEDVAILGVMTTDDRLDLTCTSFDPYPSLPEDIERELSAGLSEP